MASPSDLTIVVPGDDPPQIQGSSAVDRLRRLGDLTLYTDRPASFEEKIERVKDADVIVNTRSLVTWRREEFAALPKLRLIAVCSIGVDNIVLEAVSDHRVVVSNQPGKIEPFVAEHTIGLMFAVAKRVGFQTAELRAGRWANLKNIYLRGKTLGVIGTGPTGSQVAELANAMGMRVIAWTFHPSLERAKRLGVEFVELDDLLQQSDVVSLHVRLTEDTENMIGAREFDLMKPGALFVNVGRGRLTDHDALVSALNSGHLAGAALDTFDVEPLPADHPLLSCDQLVMTPHVADQTPEGVEAFNQGVVDNVIAFLEGNPNNVLAGPR